MASNIIKQLKNGISADDLLPEIKKLKKRSFKTLLEFLTEKYHHDNAIVSDREYDLIESIYESLFGKNESIGATPTSDIVLTSGGLNIILQKVALPYHMGSLDKLKEEKPLILWRGKWKSEFIVSDKLDGVSVCLDSINGKIHLYKRGDDKVGTDISHLVPYLDLPELKKDITIRGELIIPIKTFEKVYSQTMKNPRNTVSGFTNSKNYNPEDIKNIHLVAYQIYGSNDTIETQLQNLKKLNFKVVNWNTLQSDDITVDNLTEEVKYRKLRSAYEMDGIVITANLPVEYPSCGNPKYSVAFKISGDTCVTEVLEIEWNVSKHGLLKPRVKVEPVQLNGVTIEYASGFNAKFIVDNGVGKGAKIVITRSGDVIPDILEVIQKVTPDLPTVKYMWNENKVEFVITDFDNNKELNIKRIETFFKELGAKYLAETTVTKLYDNGFDTLKKFLNASVEDISKVDSFKDKSGERLVQSIKESIKDIPVYRVMSASSLFPNFGVKRLKNIVEEIPDYNKLSSEELLERINNIKGFKKLSDVFVNNLQQFNKFLKMHSEIQINNSEETYTGNKALNRMTIVFSGIRGYESFVEKCGGKVSSAVSKQTSLLVVKELDIETTKNKKAKELGVPIILVSEFKTRFNIQ